MAAALARDPIYRRRRSPAEAIELCVRWYLTYRLSYRDLAAMMAERGINVSHTTILRWVLRYVPEYESRWRATHGRSTHPGAWMRPQYRSADAGTISTGLSTNTESQLITCCAPIGAWRRRKRFSEKPWQRTRPIGRARSISTATRRVTARCDSSATRIPDGGPS